MARKGEVACAVVQLDVATLRGRRQGAADNPVEPRTTRRRFPIRGELSDDSQRPRRDYPVSDAVIQVDSCEPVIGRKDPPNTIQASYAPIGVGLVESAPGCGVGRSCLVA